MFDPVVLGARWMEARARRRAALALDRLSLIEPQMVQRVEASGAVQVVAAFDLATGNRIRVAHADTVPADGRVARGAALLDESLLTGEPTPARREAGDRVSAGSVNLGGEFDLTVERVGAASLLGQLRHLLERGLASRPAVAEAADRLAPALVALVLLAAVATALGWLAVDPPRALPAVIAVLVVTCPCALALATPLTLALAAGRFADAGVIPLRLAALDALATARVMLLDKTGTLTAGRPTVEAVVPFGGLTEAQARATAGGLAEQSPHPVALALRADQSATSRATNVQTHPGAGVSGCIDGASWRLGSPEFVGVPPAAQAQARHWLQQGRMVAALGDGAGRGTGRGAVFALHDAPRPGLAGLAAQLEALGVQHTVCVSGDPGAAVGEIARAAGLAEHHAGCSPWRKLDELTGLRAQRGPVVMVGDGINDAPTLAHADASVSFADAPQLPRIAADFLLQGHSLAQLVTARRIARRARRILRQNIGWAIGYNLLAIPLAAAGWIAPWSAALGMGASAALVVANALRVRVADTNGHALRAAAD
jgi:Cu2+-exporting ATPase